ncbi:hypothetical protein D3C84_405830 [compost metagenome]
MIAGTIGRDTFVQRCSGVVEQLRRATLDLRRLRTLRTESRCRLRAFGSQHFGWGLTGQVGDVVGLFRCGCGRIGTETGDVGRQVPALTIVQLVGEGRHVSAFDTHPQGVVDRVQAQAIQPRGIAQIGWRRRQADTGWAITGPRIAMTDRAMLGVHRRTTGWIRCNDWRLTDLIGHRQLRTELPCLTGNVRAVLPRSNGFAQCADTLLQHRFFRLGRQAGDQALQDLAEFQLLAVFRLIDDFAGLDRLRVIGADVIKQMQRLRRTFYGVGQQIGTAQGKQRQYQPGQETGRGSHE